MLLRMMKWKHEIRDSDLPVLVVCPTWLAVNLRSKQNLLSCNRKVGWWWSWHAPRSRVLRRVQNQKEGWLGGGLGKVKCESYLGVLFRPASPDKGFTGCSRYMLVVEDGSWERFSGPRTRWFRSSAGGKCRSGVEGSKRVVTSTGTRTVNEWSTEDIRAGHLHGAVAWEGWLKLVAVRWI